MREAFPDMQDVLVPLNGPKNMEPETTAVKPENPDVAHS